MSSLRTIPLILLVGSLLGCGANGGLGGVPGAGGAGTGSLIGDDGFDDNGDLVGDGSNTDTGFPNDGSIDAGSVVDGGLPIAGVDADPAKNFVCTQTASLFSGATAEPSVNGLVGNVVSGGLLGLLGGDSVTALLNSIADANLAIDTDLRTAASFTLTASGLDPLLGALGLGLDSLDLNIVMPEGVTIGAGRYAVFAISFPDSLLNANLASSIAVTTFRDGEPVDEGLVISNAGLSLIGNISFNLAGNYAFVGYRSSGAYDTAQISLSADLLNADVGEALYVHELCTDGQLVDPAS